MCHFKTAKNKARRGQNGKQEPCECQPNLGSAEPSKREGCKYGGFAAQWELLGSDGLRKQMLQKGAATHRISGLGKERNGRVWKGLWPTDRGWAGGWGCPGHRLHPPADTPGWKSRALCSPPAGGAVLVSQWLWLARASPCSESFNHTEFQVFHRDQAWWYKCIFNPRLRHLVSVLIQHLHSGAHSLLQALNFPWNRCENQREHSDLVFCFTRKEPRSFHMVLLSCDIDAHLPSCSPGPHEFQSLLLTKHFTLRCIRWKLHWVATQEIRLSLHPTPVPNLGWGMRP